MTTTRLLRHLLLGLVLCCQATAWAATVHVNNITGKDQNTGQSAEQAVRTFQKAVSLLQVGDTLHIANTGQAYHECLMINRALGTPDKPLIVKGNGAVLSGFVLLDANKWEPLEAGIFAHPIPPMPSNLAPVLMAGTQLVPTAVDQASLKEGQCLWQKNRLLYKPPAGKSIADEILQATLIDSGVAISNASYITIGNLISERHANDGFNIHGDSRGIVLENVVGRYNGDDGCSVHEDGELFVRNGYFHHNQFGIEDVHVSRSTYQHVKVEHNHVGVHFMGGFHRLTDSIVQNNQTDQLQVGRGFPAAYLSKDNLPFSFDGFCLVKNTQITGGVNGVLVVNRGKVALYNCLMSQSQIGILLLNDAHLEMRHSLVHHCTTSEMRLVKANYLGDYNLFYPGRLDIDNKRQLALPEFQSITKTDEHSVILEPVFEPESPVLKANPFADHQPAPGLITVYPDSPALSSNP